MLIQSREIKFYLSISQNIYFYYMNKTFTSHLLFINFTNLYVKREFYVSRIRAYFVRKLIKRIQGEIAIQDCFTNI